MSAWRHDLKTIHWCIPALAKPYIVRSCYFVTSWPVKYASGYMMYSETSKSFWSTLSKLTDVSETHLNHTPSQPLSLGTPCSLISTTLGPWASQLDSSHPGSGSPLISTHLRISTSLSISASQPDSMSQPISTISTTLISPHTSYRLGSQVHSSQVH